MICESHPDLGKQGLKEVHPVGTVRHPIIHHQHHHNVEWVGETESKVLSHSLVAPLRP